jgi:hypothetical protein
MVGECGIINKKLEAVVTNPTGKPAVKQEFWVEKKFSRN